jgi:C-terminal processing protease CtpA/Prc
VTSGRTGSAAEEFSYDIQTHKLGTLVGAVTVGAANPGGLFRLSPNFAAFIATGRAINPITKTNWEGVGVMPDTLVTAGTAMRAAYVMALRQVLERFKDDADRAEGLRETIVEAEKRPTDPEEEFVRRRR